jgi:hypothetical protein
LRVGMMDQEGGAYAQYVAAQCVPTNWSPRPIPFPDLAALLTLFRMSNSIWYQDESVLHWTAFWSWYHGHGDGKSVLACLVW